MPHLKTVFLLTGSNIEPRDNYLKKAMELIGKRVGGIVKKSSIYESEPWGFDDDIPFLNQVLKVNADLPALTVLERILVIENEMGRSRKGKTYISRKIDIDILYYSDEVINHDKLIVPHPRLNMRRFTLLPLIEIAPELIHPVLQQTNQDLLLQCDDNSKVWKY